MILGLCLLNFVFQHHEQYFLNEFASHFFQLNINSIVKLNLDELEFRSIQFKLQSMYLNSIQVNLNPFQFNSSCMQHHSIFLLKWNLISSKSIHFFIN